MKNKTSPATPSILNGAVAVDDRGSVRFVNDFQFQDVKRFYQVENFEVSTIRAFHGHEKEAKYVYVTSGSALVCAVYLDSLTTPSKEEKVERFVLSAQKPSVLYIPPQYANGFRVLTPDTKILFFSTSTLDESLGDDYRFPHDYWGEDIWNVVYR